MNFLLGCRTCQLRFCEGLKHKYYYYYVEVLFKNIPGESNLNKESPKFKVTTDWLLLISDIIDVEGMSKKTRQ